MFTGPAACAAPANWDDFKARFVTADGRVVDTGNGNISHSEGQGYAMVMAAAYGDRATFDKVWQWTGQTLERKDVRLFAWRYDPGSGQISDPNNATDGDLLIAWGLLRAGRQWKVPQNLQDSADIRKAILAKLQVRAGARTLIAPGLTGFVHPDSLTINPSYAVMPALDAFAALEPHSPWPMLRDQALQMLRDAQFGPNGLPSDWVRADTAGALWTDPDKPPQFGFDAVRVPLYLCWSGRCADKALDGIRRWWAPSRSGEVKPPAWVDVSTGAIADFPASAGVQAIVRLTLNGGPQIASTKGEDYYSSALIILSEIAAREGKAGRKP